MPEPSMPIAPELGPDCPLVLGSRSPRRKEILEGLGLSLELVDIEVDETPLDEERPDAYAARIVAAKLDAAVAAVDDARPRVVLVADTLVVVGDRILDKPADDQEARQMLRSLVGRRHVVTTAYGIAVSGQSQRRIRRVSTEVQMRAASDDELERYVGTGECADKAGAYAIQGIGSFLVERIDGSYGAVVGLPACEVVADLLEIGALRRFPSRQT